MHDYYVHLSYVIDLRQEQMSMEELFQPQVRDQEVIEPPWKKTYFDMIKTYNFVKWVFRGCLTELVISHMYGVIISEITAARGSPMDGTALWSKDR